MIDLEEIHCASSLNDCCGVVFEYQRTFYRALFPRGQRIFQDLSRDGWMERLVEKGLARMRWTDLHLPGYVGIIELERLHPVIPPFMWTTQMLAEAALVVCELARELLTRDLVIWDLKEMSNMTFSAQRGPLLIDIGAVYSVQELEGHVLTTSVESLFNQIVSSFYFPLWLSYGPLRRLRLVKNFLEYRRAGEPGLAFTASLSRRSTLGWKVVPGLSRARAHLHAHRYVKFFESVQRKIEPWYRASMGEMANRSEERSQIMVSEEDLQSVLRIMREVTGGIDSKVIFDVSARAEMGLKIAEHLSAAHYLITKDRAEAESVYAWRKKSGKPVLPILCDIWDRSWLSCHPLRNGCDVISTLPDVIQVASEARVPLDFVGQILSSLTRHVAIVGVGEDLGETNFPGFVSSPIGAGDPIAFVLATVGKHFRRHEVVRYSEGRKSSLLILYK
jgi:hypothetical protein